MKARVIWLEGLEELLAEMSAAEAEIIFEKVDLLEHYPRMYPLLGRGRFRRHRRFVAGNWIVFYRVVENTVYIRGLWSARIP